MSQRQATNVEEVVIEKRVTRSQRNKLQKEASSSVVEPKGASKRNRAGKNDFLDQLREVIGDEVQEKENIANNQSVKNEATTKSPTKNTKKKARNKKTVKFIDLTTQDSDEEENITKAVEPTPEVDVKPQRSTKRKGKKTAEEQEDTTINKEPPKEKPKRGKGKVQPKTEAAAVEITKTPDDDAVSEETKEPKRRGRNAKKTTKQETTPVDSNIIKTEAIPEKIPEEVIEKPKRNRRGKKESPQEVVKAPECEEVPESVEPEEKPKKGRRKAKAKPEKEPPQESVEISNNQSPEKVEPVVVPEKGRRRRAKAKLEEEPPLEPAQDLDNESPEEKTEIKKPKRVPRRAQTKEDTPLEPEVTTSRRRNRAKKDEKIVPEKEPLVKLSTSPILINDSLTKEDDIIIEELPTITPEIESTSSEQLAASPKLNKSIQIEEVPDLAENMDVSTDVEEVPVTDEPLEHFETTTEQKEIEATSAGLNMPQNEDLNEEKEVNASSEDFETLPEQKQPHFAQDVSIVFEKEVSITCAPAEDFEMLTEQEETPEKNEDVSTDFEKEIYATDVPSEDNETSVNLEDPELAESSNVSKDFKEDISLSDAESEDLKSLTLSEEYEVLPEEDDDDKDSEHEISVNDSGLLEKSHMEKESSFTALTNAEQTEPIELLNPQENPIENMDVSSESNVMEDQLSFSEKKQNVSNEIPSPKRSDQNESLQEHIQSVSNESSVENLLGKYIDYSISNNYILTDKKGIESNSQVENFTLFLNLDDSEECLNTSLAESEDRSKLADTSSQKSLATPSEQEKPEKNDSSFNAASLVNKPTETHKTDRKSLKDQTFGSEDCNNASLQVQCEPGELEVTGSEISSFNNSSVYSTMSTNIGDEESPRDSLNNVTVDLSSMLQKNLRFTPQSVRKCKTPKSASKIGNKFYSPMKNTEEYFSEEYSEPSTTNFEDFVAPTVTQEVSVTSIEEINVVEAPIEQTPMTAISQLLQNNLKFTPDTVNVGSPEAEPKLVNKFYEIVENDEDIAKQLDKSIAAIDAQEINPTPFEENHAEEAPIEQTPMTAISEMLQNNLIFTPNAVQVQSPEADNKFYEIVENDDYISEQLDENTTEYLEASPKTQEQKSPAAPVEKQTAFDTPKHNSLEDSEDIIEQTPMTAISNLLQNNLKFTTRKATPQSASKLGNKFYNLAENDGLVEQLDNSSVEFESLETPETPRENLFNSPVPDNVEEAQEKQPMMDQESEENISVQLSASFLHNLRITPKSVKKQTPKRPTDSDATSNGSFRTANLDNNSSFNSSTAFRTPKTTSSFGTPRTLKSRAVPNIVITQATPFADIPSTPTNTPVKNLRSTTTPSTSGKGTPKNTPAAENTRVLRSVTPKMTPAQQLRTKTYTPRSDVKTSPVQNVSRTATPVRQINSVRGTPRSEVKTTPLRVSHENTPIRQLRTASFTPRSGVKPTPNKSTSPNNSFAQSVSPKTTPIQVRTATPKFTPSVGVKQTPNKTMTPKNTPSLSVSPKPTPIQQLRSGTPRFTPNKSTIKSTPALSVSPKATPIQQLRTETPNRTPRSVAKNTPIQNVSRVETPKMPHLSVSRTATPKATPKRSVSPSATPKNTPNASVARIDTPKTTPGEYSKLTRAVTPKNTPIPSVLTPKNQARKGFSTLFAQTDVTRLEDVELTLVENSMLLDRAESPEYVHQMSKIDESEESVILIDTESETENDSSVANINEESFTSSLKTRDSYVTAKDVTTVVDSESDSEEPQQYLSAPSNETSFTSMLSSKNTTGTFYTAKNTLCGSEIDTTGESGRTLESENAHFNSFATRSHNTSLFSGVTPLEKTNDSTVSSQMIEELQYESAPHEESAEAPNVEIKVDSFNESSFEISMHFNDTLDDMEKALKYGLDYSTDDGIETTPDKSVNDLEANRAPPQIISGSFMSAPSTMLGSSSRIPRFNEPKPSTSKQSPFKVPLLAKTPKSCLKAKPFQNVVSPIGIYIKNTPAPFQVKKVTPNVNNRGAIPKIPKPTVPRGKQRAHKNLVESLPEVVYKPSKISSESSCKEISLPESIQQYLCNTQIIKHDKRLHATPKPSGAAVTNKLLQGDLTCIEDDEQNISVRTKKQTFKF